MTPADRILAVCAEMRAAEEYGLVGPMQYGAWRQALEDVAAVLNVERRQHLRSSTELPLESSRLKSD